MDDSARHHPPATAAAVVSGSPPEPSAPPAPSRRDRLSGPLLIAGLVGGFTVALHFRDPHSPGSWGLCPWLQLTGQFCPGCGALRAVNDLSHGDLVGAASSNLLFVAAIPLLVLWWVSWTRRAWSGHDAPARPGSRHPGVWIAVFVVVMVVFGVVRNVTAGSWLAP